MYDRKGTELKAGDKVLIPCTVVDVQAGEGNTSITVETEEGPVGQLYLLANQVEKVDPAGEEVHPVYTDRMGNAIDTQTFATNPSYVTPEPVQSTKSRKK